MMMGSSVSSKHSLQQSSHIRVQYKHEEKTELADEIALIKTKKSLLIKATNAFTICSVNRCSVWLVFTHLSTGSVKLFLSVLSSVIS